MGYSARYHAVTLISVFLALGIGILIGVGFGDAVVSGAQHDLESSLKGDLADARRSEQRAREEVVRLEEFATAVYPALADGRLTRRHIALVGLGGLPGEVSSDVKDALAPTGARLSSVGVIGDPLDTRDMADALEDTGFAEVDTDGGRLERLGRRVGEELVGGGRLLTLLRNRIFDRVSGRLGRADGIVLVRARDRDVKGDDKRAFDRFERGILAGLGDSDAPVVAVERSETEHSSMEFLQKGRISTVDNVDTEAGRLAMVFALGGAEGDFGTGPRADRLLPDLLTGTRSSGG